MLTPIDGNHRIGFVHSDTYMPTRMTTREDYRKPVPIVVSSGRKGVDDVFRVWFPDVRVKLDGSGDWIQAE
jgi:hypothetical protein